LSKTLVLDTHVWVKFVAGAPLKKQARAAIERAASAGGRVRIPSISLWEIARLEQDGRLKLGERPARWFDAALATIAGELVDLSPAIALTAAALVCHGDPADRLIMATAIELDSVLLTRDNAILEYATQSETLRVLEA
jgi:PIN domain nuclease of toxin-antitoxin system